MLNDEVIRIADRFRDKTFVVGLSGGADSVCLTHVLKINGFSVVAAHINHGIRGEEADGDEQFVKEFCRRFDIPLFVKHADVPSLAKEWGCGIEDAGRRVRYDFFSSVPVENKITATAHNKCDAAETVLLNLIRGSGGLRGIPERDDCVRPLINVTRAEIEEYCRGNYLNYRTDSTNLKEDYTRNKIRLSIIPELKKINPSVEDAILRAAEVSRLDREFSDSAADGVHVLKKGDRWFVEYSDIPEAVLYRVIRKLYARCHGCEKNISYENVRSAAELVINAKTGKIAELGNGICLETVYGGFLVGTLPDKIEFCVKIEDKAIIPEADIEISLSQEDRSGGIVSFDADKTGEIIARSRRNGDRLCLNGFTKKLKDIMIDRKIPKYLRDRMVVLEGKSGIVGVIGIGFDKNFIADDKTVNFLNTDWREYNE